MVATGVRTVNVREELRCSRCGGVIERGSSAVRVQRAGRGGKAWVSYVHNPLRRGGVVIERCQPGALSARQLEARSEAAQARWAAACAAFAAAEAARWAERRGEPAAEWSCEDPAVLEAAPGECVCEEPAVAEAAPGEPVEGAGLCTRCGGRLTAAAWERYCGWWA